MKDPLVTLSGHGKPVALLQWHPTASNVLASAAKDPSVKIWDVERATAKYTLEGFGACFALCAALWGPPLLCAALSWRSGAASVLNACD